MSRLVSPVGAFLLVAGLGLDDGGYHPTAWGWSAVALLVILILLLGRGVGRPQPAAVVQLGALGALTVWTGASILWSSDVSASVLEVQRVLLYLAAAAVFVLVAAGPLFLAGVLAGIAALCAYGLSDVEAGQRLADPLGYANGMGILAVMGLLLAAGFAARSASTVHAAAASAVVPMLVACLYLTFSRGAWLALGVGLGAAAAVGPRRLQWAATALALAVPGALAVLFAERLGASASLGVLLVLLAAAAAAIPYALREAPSPPRRARTAFAVALCALPLAVLAAGLVKLGGPTEVVEAFKGAPAPTHGQPSARVFDLSGRNRADYWSVAWESYEEEPALGIGAGSYARAWLRERPVPQPVTDAHNLYLETLAELGPAGLALLLTALAAPLFIRRSDWTPLALAPYGAFLAHTAQDWDWELPVVTVVALACAAALVAGKSGPRVPRLVAVMPAILCVLTAVALLGNDAVERSSAASDELRWSEAKDAARRARSLQPWSPEPWRLLGEIELAEGSLAEARRHFRRGLREDPNEFELWIGLGLASDGAARQEAFARAAALNPLSPELEELGFESRRPG